MPPPRLQRSAAHRTFPAAGLLALAAAVGCSQVQIDPNPPPHYTAPVVLDAAAPPGTYLAVERTAADVLATQAADHPAPGNRPLNVLVVSGGGQFGSFDAGALVGWTCRGDRPDFDVVTGISSGALVAVIAYVGPKYDPVLQRLFTTLRTKDLFRYPPVTVHLVRDKSMASTEPLKRLIDETLNEEFFADMQAAHRAGRRLFVGTMNMLSRKPVYWDLGAIACSGRPDALEQVRRVVLATCSISGMSPPVPIDVEVNGVCVREYHVDCGGLSQAFIRFGPETPRPDPANPAARWLAGSNLYILAGGKLYKDVLDRPPGVVGAMRSNVSANLFATFRCDAWKIYTFCVASGMSYHLALIPPEAYTGDRSTEFDPDTQRQLFTIGYDMIMRGTAWRTTPPGYEPGEEAYPRAGFRFTVPAGQPPAAPAAPAPPAPRPAEAPPPENAVVRPAVRVRHFTLFDMPKL